MKKLLAMTSPLYDHMDNVGARCQGRRRTNSSWFPIWPAYPVGMLQGAKLFDASMRKTTPEEAVELAGGYDYVLLHPAEGTMTRDMEFARLLKASRPSVRIIMAGQAATVSATEILKEDAVDAVAIDEYDYTIKEAVESDSLEVRGLLSRRSSFLPREKPEDLDALPWVSRVFKRDLDVNDYYLPFVRRPYIQVYDSRGCTAHCTFCLTPQTFTSHHASGHSVTVRHRSPEDVVAEMLWIREAMPQVRETFVDGDTLTDYTNIRSGWLDRFCQLLRPTGLVWSCNVRADVRYDVLSKLKGAGCRLIVVGYESFNDELLRAIHKGVSSEMEERFTVDAQRAGLMIQACFIIGLPGETQETVRRDIDFAVRHHFNNIQIAPAHAFKGTELYDWGTKHGYIDSSLLSKAGRQLPQINQPQFTREDTEKAINAFLARFILSPGFAKQLITDIGRGGRPEVERISRNVYEFSKDLLMRRLGL